MKNIIPYVLVIVLGAGFALAQEADPPAAVPGEGMAYIVMTWCAPHHLDANGNMPADRSVCGKIRIGEYTAKHCKAVLVRNSKTNAVALIGTTIGAPDDINGYINGKSEMDCDFGPQPTSVPFVAPIPPMPAG